MSSFFKEKNSHLKPPCMYIYRCDCWKFFLRHHQHRRRHLQGHLDPHAGQGQLGDPLRQGRVAEVRELPDGTLKPTSAANSAFKHVMEKKNTYHVNVTIFFHKFATLVSLIVPSGR